MTFLQKLDQIVNYTDTRAGRLFDWTIQTLILVSVISMSLETLPDLYIYHEQFIRLDHILVAIFLAEYILRLVVAKKKLEFIFSFYGVIDLLAILPTIASWGVVDLRFLRSMRFLRVVRILKLARYVKALERIKAAFNEVKHELAVFSFLASIILYISSAGIYFFEHAAQPDKFKSVFHSFWWAIATLTTVGYGDTVPITTGGRIFTFVILMLCLGFVSIPSALLASAFSNDEKRDHIRKINGIDQK